MPFAFLLLLLFPLSVSSSLKLRCCTGLASPLISRDPLYLPYRYSGLSVSYLLLLEHRLGLRCVDSSDSPFIRVFPENGSRPSVGWEEVINKISECKPSGSSEQPDDECLCDIGIGGWYETVDRTHVHFVAEFSDGDVRVVIKKQDATSTLGSAFFVKTFEWKTWLAIVGLFAIAVLVMSVEMEQPGEGKKGPVGIRRVRRVVMKNDMVYRVRKSAQSVVEKMFAVSGSGGQQTSTGHWRWTFGFCLALCGLYLLLVYEAMMANEFIQERHESSFTTIHGLASCNIRPSEICFARGDVIEKIWSSISQTAPCLQTESPVISNSYSEAISDLLEDKCKYLITDGGVALQAVNGRYCGKLLLTGEPFFPNGLHAVLPKHSPYKDMLDKATLELRESGQLKTTGQYFQGERTCVTQPQASLNVRKLASFFWVAFVVCGIMFAEMVFDPQNDPKQRDQSRDQSQQ